MEATVSRLAAFFKDADTELGVFYPKHYLLAVFPNIEDAVRAEAVLRRAGRAEDEVISASGDQVVHFAQDHVLQDGLWGLMMTQVSRMLGTEAAYADEDLVKAKQGAAFVAVHCPTEQIKAEVWKCLEPARPLAARYYSAGGIEHLAAN